MVKVNHVNQPEWRSVTVKMKLPVELQKLQEISRNLWWVWNFEAQDLFKNIDPELWRKTHRNPVVFLDSLTLERLEELVADKAFIANLDAVYAKFRAYMDEKPDASKPSVAYFSMEFGLTDVVKIFSGGLGMLAGDYLKEASDSNVPMTGVGFLYRFGYFTQTLSMNGEQLANYEAQDFNKLPIEQVLDENGEQLVLAIPYSTFTVYVNVWRVAVGRVSLYLLDTDTDRNSEYDRSITSALYGGDWENRLKQEYLLGIGGIQLLKRLGIEKDIYHCNEGHAALINVQRLVDYVASGLKFAEALEVVRASSLYTVHTPVPAGHDFFDEGLFSKYMNQYPAMLGISWQEFMDMGRENPGSNEKFCMSTFACNTSQEVNGVSWLHGKVSREMFNGIWKGYFPEELHVGYVTNGVHMPTWTASEWKALYTKQFAKTWMKDQSNASIWEAIQQVPDEEIWNIRMQLKNKLFDFIKVQFKESWLKNQGNPSHVMALLEKINPNALTIGFARRFATYKRAHLLFTDLDRLAEIVNNPNYPVQFIFAGKAHPADGAGQGLIKRIVEVSRMPQFIGKIIFLENYDMTLARRLVSGVDIWMNTPTRPLEASGTSGEKAEMNGVLNFSVLDGWWLEGYREGAGWALTEKRTYQNQAHQDQLDAATIYSMLENEIIPLYFAKNSRGYSPEWIQTIKNSISQIAPHYTMKRQLDDYYSKFYNKQAKRATWIKENNYSKAKEIAAWKEKVAAGWDQIELVSRTPAYSTMNVGETVSLDIVMDTKGLGNCIGLELVVTDSDIDNKLHLLKVQEFDLVEENGSILKFNLNYTHFRAGSLKTQIRMFPKNADLPHRQDFCYVRWF